MNMNEHTISHIGLGELHTDDLTPKQDALAYRRPAMIRVIRSFLLRAGVFLWKDSASKILTADKNTLLSLMTEPDYLFRWLKEQKIPDPSNI